MSKTLVECVPNFSAGRDPKVVAAIAEAMRLPGVYLLDQEMDHDHNRSVITLAGEREAVLEAAIRGVGKAAELIDLTRHQGVHPRMGAADVVPFIPIEGLTLEDCAEMAREAGAEIARRYGIPVYLYEAAATTPERQRLENVRRGQFEGLREEIAANPARRPDFGEPRIHPTAGAVAVGARKFLVAYNIFLNTPDLEVAKEVAKAVRFSSGGLRHVKASGFLVRNLAQVSMNLTDFEQTPIHRVFECVRREAARYGVLPLSSEIIGLVPKLALEETAAWYLQIENFRPSLILENRLAAVRAEHAANAPQQTATHSLPTPSPTQGERAAATCCAMAAELAQLGAAALRQRHAPEQPSAPIQQALSRLELLRTALASGSAEPLQVASQAEELAALMLHLRGLDGGDGIADLSAAHALAHAAHASALAYLAQESATPSSQEFPS